MFPSQFLSAKKSSELRKPSPHLGELTPVDLYSSCSLPTLHVLELERTEDPTASFPPSLFSAERRTKTHLESLERQSRKVLRAQQRTLHRSRRVGSCEDDPDGGGREEGKDVEERSFGRNGGLMKDDGRRSLRGRREKVETDEGGFVGHFEKEKKRGGGKGSLEMGMGVGSEGAKEGEDGRGRREPPKKRRATGRTKGRFCSGSSPMPSRIIPNHRRTKKNHQ